MLLISSVTKQYHCGYIKVKYENNKKFLLIDHFLDSTFFQIFKTQFARSVLETLCHFYIHSLTQLDVALPKTQLHVHVLWLPE